MTPLFLLGFALQILSLALFWLRFRRVPIRRLGFLFVAITFLYSGASELVVRITGHYNRYRWGTDHDDVDQYVVLVGLIMLAFSVLYLLSTRFTGPLGLRHEAAESLRWYLLRNRIAILALATISFVAFQLARVQSDDAYLAAEVYEGYWVVSLSDATWLHLVLLGALCLLMSNARHLRPTVILIGLCAVLSTMGSRSGLVFPVILAAILMLRAGVRLGRREIATIALYSLLFMASVTCARQIVGREAIVEASPLERVRIYFSSLAERSSIADGFVADVGARLDANTFGAIVLDQQHKGARPTWWTTWIIDLQMHIPRAIMPSKIDRDLTRRNAEAYLVAHYNAYPADYCTGWSGLLLASFGPFGSVVGGGVLGLLLARIDEWSARTTHLAGFFVYLVLLESVVWYEKMFSQILFTAKGFLIALAAIYICTYGLRLVRGKAGPPPPHDASCAGPLSALNGR